MTVSILGPFENWLEQFINYEKRIQKPEFALDSIRLLAEMLGNPQDAYNAIHVAGSKGKGSVSEMIASILHESGKKEGLYTSPHVADFSERVGRAHGVFSPEVYQKSSSLLMEIVDKTDPSAFPGGKKPTWFELVTAFCFLCFKNSGVDWGVFETGMGGRLDATNILKPALCVLTPIEREHAEILGNTVGEIAGEKAGIIKNGVPVCSAKQTADARTVIEARAKEKQSSLFFIEDCISSFSYRIERENMSVCIDFDGFSPKKGGNALFKRPLAASMKLFGRAQAENAALAALAVKLLFPETEERVIERGLESSKLSGRFDISYFMYDNRYTFRIILDSAHTKNSVQNTIETAEAVCANEEVHLLFACAADKEVEEMVPLFFASTLNIRNITVTIPGCHKKADFPRLAAAFKNGPDSIPQNADQDYVRAIHSALENAAVQNATLLATGSFYLLDETLKALHSGAFRQISSPDGLQGKNNR